MIRANSSLRKKRTFYYGWKDGGVYFLSVSPREANEAANQYDTALQALADASARSLPIQWEDPGVVS